MLSNGGTSIQLTRPTGTVSRSRRLTSPRSSALRSGNPRCPRARLFHHRRVASAVSRPRQPFARPCEEARPRKPSSPDRRGPEPALAPESCRTGGTRDDGQEGGPRGDGERTVVSSTLRPPALRPPPYVLHPLPSVAALCPAAHPPADHDAGAPSPPSASLANHS